eukprot:m.120513 g.120513  ORF g.120513 m.120513 type:complete len:324 (-) comp16179_c1_seq1:699-1670(-)
MKQSVQGTHVSTSLVLLVFVCASSREVVVIHVVGAGKHVEGRVCARVIVELRPRDRLLQLNAQLGSAHVGHTHHGRIRVGAALGVAVGHHLVIVIVVIGLIGVLSRLVEERHGLHICVLVAFCILQLALSLGSHQILGLLLLSQLDKHRPQQLGILIDLRPLAIESLGVVDQQEDIPLQILERAIEAASSTVLDHLEVNRVAYNDVIRRIIASAGQLHKDVADDTAMLVGGVDEVLHHLHDLGLLLPEVHNWLLELGDLELQRLLLRRGRSHLSALRCRRKRQWRRCRTRRRTHTAIPCSTSTTSSTSLACTSAGHCQRAGGA